MPVPSEASMRGSYFPIVAAVTAAYNSRPESVSLGEDCGRLPSRERRPTPRLVATIDDGVASEDPSSLSSAEGPDYLMDRDLQAVPERFHRSRGGSLSARGLRPTASAASLASTSMSVRSSAMSDSGTATLSSITPPTELSNPLPSLPPCFRCPINQEIMTDPVFAADGVTYERENILAYFGSGRRVSPATGRELRSLELLPNVALRQGIESYRELHGAAEQLQRDWEAFMIHQNRRANQKLVHRHRQLRALKSALEQSDRRIHALEAGAGIARSEPASSAVSTADCASTVRTPELSSPVAQPLFKSGPAPKAARSASLEKPLRRRKGACLPFFPSVGGC